MQVFKAVEGSSIWDVCLNTYESLNFLGKLMLDNNFTDINSKIKAGQLFVYDETLVTNLGTQRSVSTAFDNYATSSQRAVAGAIDGILTEGGQVIITEDGQTIINE